MAKLKGACTANAACTAAPILLHRTTTIEFIRKAWWRMQGKPSNGKKTPAPMYPPSRLCGAHPHLIPNYSSIELHLRGQY